MSKVTVTNKNIAKKFMCQSCLYDGTWTTKKDCLTTELNEILQHLILRSKSIGAYHANFASIMVFEHGGENILLHEHTDICKEQIRY